jgi:hypothetical protein
MDSHSSINVSQQ